jgi:hypothetical protein
MCITVLVHHKRKQPFRDCMRVGKYIFPDIKKAAHWAAFISAVAEQCRDATLRFSALNDYRWISQTPRREVSRLYKAGGILLRILLSI